MSEASHPAVPSRSPRVLVWYWGRRGGGANFTLRLAKHLIDLLGPDNVAIAIAGENEHRSDLEDLNVELILTPAAWTGNLTVLQRVRRLRANLSFARTLKREAFDTVIITMNFPLAWPLIHAISRSSTRLVYVAHDALPHAGDYMRLWQSASQMALMRRADTIVTLSTSVTDRLRARFASARIPVRARLCCIPLESVFAPERHRTKVRIDGNPVRFLFLGRLLTYKGLGLLRDAINHLEGRRDWSLTIAGAGPLEGFVAQHFGQHPRCRTELGWMSRERFVDLLDEHDVLLCPYLEASQSGVIPEALARGLSAIVTPIDGLPEQIGFGRLGLVARHVDAEAFASEMLRLLGDPTLLDRRPEAIPGPAGPTRKGTEWLSVVS